MFPIWAPDSNVFAYLSNKNNDYFGQTDLYIYDLDSSSEKKVSGAVYSAPTWHPNGNMIFYSKKPKFPDKNGSRYYDLYEYDLNLKKENRLTYGARSFSPAYIKTDSSIAFLATYDGAQDVYMYDLKRDSIDKITDLEKRPMLSSLKFNEFDNCLYFDISTNHYRDIAKISLQDSRFSMVLNDNLWDERNIAFAGNGSLI